MDALKGYMEKMGSNFLIAAMIPSLAFVATTMIVFDQLLDIPQYFNSEYSIYNLLSFSLLLSIPTIIIGFTLSALNTYILKFFEGYVFLHHFSFAKKNQVKRARRLIMKREIVRKKIERLSGRNKLNTRSTDQLRQLRGQYYSLSAEYDQSYPHSLEHVLPTRFGNILRASENYSTTRYGIDAVAFWPRLLHVIPPSYQQNIEGARNELSFLVNLSLLSILFVILCILAIIYNLLPSPILGITILSDHRAIYQYLILGTFGLLSAWFFHRASLITVCAFGEMIRSAYDLFRLDLLKHLRLEPPTDSVDEYHKWKNLGEFMVLGKLSLEFTPFNYQKEKKKK